MNASNDDRDRADWGADPELLDVLRSADPAHSLPLLTSAELSRLTEAALAADRDGVELTPPGRRIALAPWVAVAALVLIAGVALSISLTRSGDGVAPVAEAPLAPVVTTVPPVDPPSVLGTSSAVPTEAPTSSATPAPPASSPTTAPVAPTVLEVPSDYTARCAVPSAALLAQQQIAFEGVVTSLGEGTAVLQTTTVYAGDVAPEVEVRAPSQEMGALLNAVQFEPGRTYLVSATDGQVTLCGYSAQADDVLRALYQQAFSG